MNEKNARNESLVDQKAENSKEKTTEKLFWKEELRKMGRLVNFYF